MDSSTKRHSTQTVVVDVGARYGMHPSWSNFSGEMRYLAFEPDPEEAASLRARNSSPNYEVYDIALGKSEETRTLNLTAHRGFSSFLAPDETSQYFSSSRPREAAIERTIDVQVEKLDTFAQRHGLSVDFLKVDTEGSDLEVLEGASQSLHRTILGVRIELHAQSCFHGQPLLSDIFTFLHQHRFTLINLDYFGRGEPQHALFRNASPILPDYQRYGTFIGADGVFMVPFASLRSRVDSNDGYACLAFKWAWFAFLNHAPDVALQGLETFFNAVPRSALSGEILTSALYRNLALLCIDYLASYRSRPESYEWELAQNLASQWFGIALQGGSGYYEQIRTLRDEYSK